VKQGEIYRVPLTRQQLAGMTGPRVETVIRSIKGLEAKGELGIEDGKIIRAAREQHDLWEEEKIMVSTAQTLIRDVVADDFRTAAVFQRHGLDFCCGGGRSIAEASHARGIDPDLILAQLADLKETTADDVPAFNAWHLDRLIDYIVDNHHHFVRRSAPVLGAYTQKVSRVHGASHPETVRIAGLFDRIAADLTMHMQKEENILFPYIKVLAEADRTGAPPPVPFFGSIENPIRMMEAEHADAGNDMEEIRTLSNGFTPPEDACTTFRVSYQELQAFERDLHQHVHLENNILFPKAIELERKLRAGAPAGACCESNGTSCAINNRTAS